MQSRVYVNHAHNDVLEVWLETGVLGLVLMGLFVVLVRAAVGGDLAERTTCGSERS